MINLNTVPLYISEVAPAHKRGLLSGLTAVGFAMGYLVYVLVYLAHYTWTNARISCSWVGYGASFSTNLTLQWRLPLALAALAPLILSGLVWAVPESPRFLSWMDRNEEAWTIVQRLHHDPHDPSDSAARAEFHQITKQVQYDRQQKTGYIQMASISHKVPCSGIPDI